MFVKLFDNRAVGDVNIQSLSAYIVCVNPSIDVNKKVKYISRFPIEPTSCCYEPTAHNINCSGCSSYYVFPKRRFVGSFFDFNCRPKRRKDFSKYLAPTKATDNKSVVEILFPAEAQKFVGNYKLIVVAKLYEPGYFENNLKTVTIDYPDVFTLVGSSQEGIDNNVTMNIGDVDRMIDLYGDKNIVVGKTYTITTDVTGDVDIKWFCKEPNVVFLEEGEYSLVYTVTELPEEDKDMNFEILALSKKDNRILGRKNICVRANQFVGDIHAESGIVNGDTGNIEIGLNNGQSFNVDMASHLLWYEGD